jgi:hypothetical protein
MASKNMGDMLEYVLYIQEQFDAPQAVSIVREREGVIRARVTTKNAEDKYVQYSIERDPQTHRLSCVAYTPHGVQNTADNE